MRREAATPARLGPERAALETRPGFVEFLLYEQRELSGPGQSRAASFKRASASHTRCEHDSRAFIRGLCVAFGVSLLLRSDLNFTGRGHFTGLGWTFRRLGIVVGLVLHYRPIVPLRFGLCGPVVRWVDIGLLIRL